MNRFASNGLIADPCGVPRSRATRVPSGCCQRRLQPPLHVQQDPPLLRRNMVGDRPFHEVPGHGVEELPDVEVDHPVAAPAPLTTGPDRVQRGSARPVPVGVRVKDRLDLRLQIHPAPPFGRPGRPPWALPAPAPRCLPPWGSPPPSPAAGNTSPTTAGSRSCTDSGPGRPRTARSTPRRPPPHPCSP